MFWRFFFEQRCRERGDHDTAKRLRAWDETLADLEQHGDDVFCHRFHTDQAASGEIARRIATAYLEHRTAAPGHQA